MDLTEFLDDSDPFFATVARLLAKDGSATEVSILANGESHLMNFEHRCGFGYPFKITILLQSNLFAQVWKDRNTHEAKIFTAAQEVARSSEDFDQYIDSVSINVKVSGTDEWRGRAKDWLTGKGVTNQGRVRSDNVAGKSCDGLLLGSQPEIYLYQALKSIGVSFAPLPVFVRGGTRYKRIEPDFFMVKDGLMMIVEVDGDTVHTETPADAYDRTTMLLHEGVKFERVRASECSTAELAKTCADKLLKVLNKIKDNR